MLHSNLQRQYTVRMYILFSYNVIMAFSTTTDDALSARFKCESRSYITLLRLYIVHCIQELKSKLLSVALLDSS